MAELSTEPSACCVPAVQASCCEPEEKAACCETAAAGGVCGCSADTRASDSAIRELVRERYAAAATAITDGGEAADPMAEPRSASSCGPASAAGASCCAPTSLEDEHGAEVFGASLYDGEDGVGDAPVQASLGCGVPTAVADLHDGDVVLDLGSGAGTDVLISARRVAPSGRAIGLDMTDEMLELARSNAAAAGVENAQFVKGYLEQLPLDDASVDVVISNCVINLSADKPRVLREAARVLRPGGRFAISDVIADPDMDDATRADMAAWTGCVAGALTRIQFECSLADAGLVDVEIRETHRVHEHAAAAVVRARKP
jgi:arsenite methyltransferase